jgi:hypothetical protein
MERINIIKKKLGELSNLDKQFAIFGSATHQYQLGQTLNEEEIIQIEAQNNIFLSTEYRSILKHLGNGGAGCGYGLEPLTLKNISPPYIGTEKLLRNWKGSKMDLNMVDLDEISGYIKLFDYGCGMETCLIVSGYELGDLIFFDCDGRFEKIKDKNVIDIYEDWLDESINILKRVEVKLNEMTLQDVIESEWKMNNFSIKKMILSLMDAKPLRERYSEDNLNKHLEVEYKDWKNRKGKSTRNWWGIFK